MKTTTEIAAEAYAQGRIDAGEPAFMDRDGFTSNVTVGAFVHRYAEAHARGQQVALITAWATFMANDGRTVLDTEPVEEVEDEMATTEQVAALHAEAVGSIPGACGISRTYLGSRTLRCTLRLGHQGKHAAAVAGSNTVTWTTDESDQALADRIHYTPASTYSTQVHRTGYPVNVPTSEQVAADLTNQEV